MKRSSMLAELGRKLRGPGNDSPEGVENDLRSNKNSQNKSHFQDHLDERMTPHLSAQDGNPKCQDCGWNHNKHPRQWFEMPDGKHDQRTGTTRKNACNREAMRMMKISAVIIFIIAQVALTKQHASRRSINIAVEDRAI